MRELTIDNVNTIHDLYPANDFECVEAFEKLVKTLPGFGIFTKGNGELAAWMMHSYYGAMFSMQTRPEYRRKGFVFNEMSSERIVLTDLFSALQVWNPSGAGLDTTSEKSRIHTVRSDSSRERCVP